MTNHLEGFTFGAPLWLWALLAVPALAGLFIWAEARADQRLRRLINAPRLRLQLTGAASTSRRRWRYALLLLGLASLIVSLALPRLGYQQQAVHRQGLDLIMVVDVSKSMLATDTLPSRLTRAKLTVQDAVSLLAGDRLGLVAFAGSAFLQAPLTIDYDAVLTATNELDTSLIPRGGTNIGAAISLALDAFGKAEASNRAIIIMSDGEPTSDDDQADGIKAAQAAASQGVKIFTVGFGTTQGSLIPVGENTGEFVRDTDGSLVRTKLDEANLTALAKAAGGFYTPFTNGEATMRRIIQDGLGKVKTGELKAHENRRPIERYQWPLSAALLFLALSTLISERRRIPAPGAIGGVSASARAIPVPRRTPGGLAPAAVALVAFCSILAFAVEQNARADDPTPTPAAPTPTPALGSAQSALALYRAGKYDEAYQAFKELAIKNPKAGNLQFDAGTSAYKSKQFDDAIQAFGNALGSDDAAMQAQAQYNFGNTLFRHGEGQSSKETKLGEWRDAIKHYDDALAYLKTHPDDDLTKNTEYNRDVVQKHIDEEMKEKKKPDQKPDQKKDDKKDQKKDDKKDDQDKGKPGDDQQDKKDGKGKGEGQGQGDPSQGSQGKSDPSQQKDPSKSDQQGSPSPSPNPEGKPDDKNGQKEHSDNKGDNGKNATPQPDKSKGDQGEKSDSQPPSDHPAGGSTPDPASVPNQDKPRERGDIKTHPADQGDKPPQPTSGAEGQGESAQLAKAEPGKMNADQARALLESLKGEDDRINLNRDHRTRDDQVKKDW